MKNGRKYANIDQMKRLSPFKMVNRASNSTKTNWAWKNENAWNVIHQKDDQNGINGINEISMNIVQGETRKEKNNLKRKYKISEQNFKLLCMVDGV